MIILDTHIYDFTRTHTRDTRMHCLYSTPRSDATHEKVENEHRHSNGPRTRTIDHVFVTRLRLSPAHDLWSYENDTKRVYMCIRKKKKIHTYFFFHQSSHFIIRTHHMPTTCSILDVYLFSNGQYLSLSL